MPVDGPKAMSVSHDGEPDGWEQPLGWYAEITPHGDTRLTVAAPPGALGRTHLALVKAMASPVSVLYRQKVDRREPRPQSAPPRDFVAREVPLEKVLEVVEATSELLHHDARCELWLQGALGERLVLDEDGVIYVYPDDPSFRDALAAAEVGEADVDLISDRDYVKHWFHAACDRLEDEIIDRLGLVEVPHRAG